VRSATSSRQRTSTCIEQPTPIHTCARVCVRASKRVSGDDGSGWVRAWLVMVMVMVVVVVAVVVVVVCVCACVCVCGGGGGGGGLEGGLG
jgi:hypothetical protein